MTAESSDHPPNGEPPWVHVVLFQPEIPQNTGNIGRMCALTRSRLHLIHPLGFATDAASVRRSGLDYWAELDVVEHADWTAFRAHPLSPARLWLFTTHGSRGVWTARFAPGDGLVFGRESAGAPDWLHAEIGTGHRLRIPQFAPQLRSLNLSTAAGIATYEALRQLTND
ncbi:MAG: tRNA (cytidine(34)-2'-O)-methyltransferase [Opitutales bacterium]